MCRAEYTLPVTSATAERTFSAMRTLKNFEGTNTKNKLNNVMQTHCHKDLVDGMSLVTVGIKT